MASTLSMLNDRFAIPDCLSFGAGPGDLPTAQIDNDHASAQVCLLGGHVLAFQPKGETPVLWMSERSRFEVGQAIRGGIPICWPWFAGHPTDRDKPGHGFVRTRLWSVEESSTLADGSTQIELGIKSDAETHALWPHDFVLRLRVNVGKRLTVTLISQNPADQPYTYTGALHSYFHIGQAEEIAIHGLAGRAYLDKTAGFERRQQEGPVQISGPTDRIYLDTDAECIIDDPSLQRRIHIAKKGSHTTVVWNPGQAGAVRMPDLADDAYASMVCVETARAADDVATVAAGGEAHLQACIWVERA